MQLSAREYLTQFSNLLQSTLFPVVEDELGPLSEKAKLLIAVLATASPAAHLPPSRGWHGRPSKDRHALACAFVAKAVYGFSKTRDVIDRLKADVQLMRLCGWRCASRIPSEATFSRAFAEFSRTQLPERMHRAVIEKTLRNCLVGHISRDSTAIEARERYPDTPDPLPKKKRYKKGPKAKRSTPRSPGNHIEEQRLMTTEQILAELPRDCSLGVKKSSKGHLSYWRGYKLHLDVADGDIPVTAVLTAAKLHDSQAAVAMMNITSRRVTYLYDLMDAAYDAKAIREHSIALGHKPIIDPVLRYRTTSEKVPLRKNSRAMKKVVTRTPILRDLDPPKAMRFRQRTSVERVNARLKDEFGARLVFYRGAAKIMAHLMFGVLALAVDQWLNRTG